MSFGSFGITFAYFIFFFLKWKLKKLLLTVICLLLHWKVKDHWILLFICCISPHLFFFLIPIKFSHWRALELQWNLSSENIAVQYNLQRIPVVSDGEALNAHKISKIKIVNQQDWIYMEINNHTKFEQNQMCILRRIMSAKCSCTYRKCF